MSNPDLSSKNTIQPSARRKRGIDDLSLIKNLMQEGEGNKANNFSFINKNNQKTPIIIEEGESDKEEGQNFLKKSSISYLNHNLSIEELWFKD